MSEDKYIHIKADEKMLFEMINSMCFGLLKSGGFEININDGMPKVIFRGDVLRTPLTERFKGSEQT